MKTVEEIRNGKNSYCVSYKTFKHPIYDVTEIMDEKNRLEQQSYTVEVDHTMPEGDIILKFYKELPEKEEK